MPDFPQPGIVFRDVTPLLRTPGALDAACALMAEPFLTGSVTQVVAIESRGFLFGPGIAARLGAGFVPARKGGKLPGPSIGVDYGLEYGTDRLELHADALGDGDRALVVDDVLATGGTAAAVLGLVSGLGATVVGVSVFIELGALGGRDRIGAVETASVVHYG